MKARLTDAKKTENTRSVKGIQPRDQVEGMLAAQMAAVHRARLELARAYHSRTAWSAPATSLARTFASQMQALKRYRTGGEQKLTVQNVSVNDGGQAIVGNVTQAPREAVRGRAAASRAHSLTLSARRWRC
jgi:hypothetical protein